MKAMILAAGLGTRLMPLTRNRPKALVPFRGMPLLERIILNLEAAGIKEIIINVHHFAGQVEEFVQMLDIPGVSLVLSDEREQLMNTGGALLHARHHFVEEDDFLVHNVDVITNLDIRKLMDAHLEGKSLATLAVKKRPTSRSLLFDGRGYLVGWRHNETGEEKFVRRAESGIHDFGNSCVQVISSKIFDHFPDNHPLNLTEMHLSMAKENRIRPFIHNEDHWYDLGRYENYLKADREVF